MSIFDRFKKKGKDDVGETTPTAVSVPLKTESAKTSVNREPKAAALANVPQEKPKEKKETPKRPTIVHKNSGAGRLLFSPVVTEKAAHLQAQGQYAFEVNPRASKNEIAKAVEDAYGVKPVSVNVVSIIKKYRRYGRHEGFTKARKKAIVTLKKGDRIELFETTS